MAYIVKPVREIYDEAIADESDPADNVGKFLSETEADGYRLVGILPDHQIWNEDGSPEGKVNAMLILFKEGNA